MAELRTPGGRSGGEPPFDPPRGDEPPFDPPRGDEGLDDWFARRLEAQGIRARRGRIPIARILAVATLAAALFALGWVLVGTSGNTKAASTTSTQSHSTAPPGSKTTVSEKGKKPLWQRIPLTVLNGFGGANAAGTAKAALVKSGWKVVSIADVAQPVTQQTVVIYVPGKQAWARVVARRLKLPAPVPIGSAAGVVATQTDGVAVLLGPDLLPNGAG